VLRTPAIQYDQRNRSPPALRHRVQEFRFPATEWCPQGYQITRSTNPWLEHWNRYKWIRWSWWRRRV